MSHCVRHHAPCTCPSASHSVRPSLCLSACVCYDVSFLVIRQVDTTHEASSSRQTEPRDRNQVIWGDGGSPTVTTCRDERLFHRRSSFSFVGSPFSDPPWGTVNVHCSWTRLEAPATMTPVTAAVRDQKRRTPARSPKSNHDRDQVRARRHRERLRPPLPLGHQGPRDRHRRGPRGGAPSRARDLRARGRAVTSAFFLLMFPVTSSLNGQMFRVEGLGLLDPRV